MSEYVYTMSASANAVMMSLKDFAKLAGELTNFGVDVAILPESTSDAIYFILKQQSQNQ